MRSVLEVKWKADKGSTLLDWNPDRKDGTYFFVQSGFYTPEQLFELGEAVADALSRYQHNELPGLTAIKEALPNANQTL